VPYSAEKSSAKLAAKEFPPALMRRYYRGTLPGNSFGNSISIFIAESISPKKTQLKAIRLSLTIFISYQPKFDI
jgi:hypothetical protein